MCRDSLWAVATDPFRKGGITWRANADAFLQEAWSPLQSRGSRSVSQFRFGTWERSHRSPPGVWLKSAWETPGSVRGDGLHGRDRRGRVHRLRVGGSA